jgi:hypothetical protein
VQNQSTTSIASNFYFYSQNVELLVDFVNDRADNGRWQEEGVEAPLTRWEALPVAENESLDLGSPNARRWDEVFNGFRNGTPWEKIASKVSTKLHDALRKVFKQLAKKGVPFAQLLAARESLGALNQLVKKTGNHPSAILFRVVCLSEHGKDAAGVLNSFVWGLWETISDQIELRLASADRTLVDLQIAVNEINQLIEPDVNRLAQKLAENPAEVPPRVGKKGSKVDATTEMLPMSLLGIQQP